MLSTTKQSNTAFSSALFMFLGCLYVRGCSAILCDTGPNALISAYKKPIPQTCIDVPVGDKGKTRERCFYTYVPKTCSEQEISEAPLVVDVHGMGSCPLWSAGYTGWMQKAEEDCIVVMWPNGNEHPMMPRCFNTPGFLTSTDIQDSSSTTTTTTSDENDDDDVTAMPCCCLDDTTFLPEDEAVDPLFLKMAIDTVIEQQSQEDVMVDTSRIYMAGHSNGCMISLAMAALYSDTIAAVACHAGAVLTPFPKDEYSPVPIMMIQGMKDDIVPYNGKTMFDFPGMGPLGFLPMNQTMNYLGNQNECTEEDFEDVFDDKGIVGRTFKKTNCKDQANIEVVALFDAGHNPYSSEELWDRTTVDTTEMAWDFVSMYSKGQEALTPRLDKDKNYFVKASSGSLARTSFSLGLVLAPFLAVVGTMN